MWPVLSGIAAAIITALVTAYLGKRAKSGRIETSEAKDLWDTLRGELARMQTQTVDLRAEVVVTRQEMAALHETAAEARLKMVEVEASLRACGLLERDLRRRLKALGHDD